MKTLIAIALALIALPAAATYCNNGATNYPNCNNQPREVAPARPSQQQAQQQSQNQAIDLSMMNNPAASAMSGGASVNQGHSYLFPSPAVAAPLPAGMCPQGNSESWSVVWGFVSYATSSTRTEMECLDKLLAYGRETQPKPAAAPIINYISSPPLAAPAACAPAKKPFKKRPVSSCKA